MKDLWKSARDVESAQTMFNVTENSNEEETVSHRTSKKPPPPKLVKKRKSQMSDRALPSP